MTLEKIALGIITKGEHGIVNIAPLSSKPFTMNMSDIEEEVESLDIGGDNSLSNHIIQYVNLKLQEGKPLSSNDLEKICDKLDTKIITSGEITKLKPFNISLSLRYIDATGLLSDAFIPQVKNMNLKYTTSDVVAQDYFISGYGIRFKFGKPEILG